MPATRLRCLILLALYAVTATGCRGRCALWNPRLHTRHQQCDLLAENQHADPAALFDWALELEAADDAGCVDQFFNVALATCAQDASDIDSPAARLHKRALEKLVVSGQRFGRLNPRCQLLVYPNGDPTRIPVTHVGFPWIPSDFHQLCPIDNVAKQELRCAYRQPGMGIPLVVTRYQHSASNAAATFLPEKSYFGATLRMNPPANNQGIVDQACTLELLNPKRVAQAPTSHGPVAIAKDLSAPIEFRIQNQPRSVLRQFLGIGPAGDTSRLYFLEPYQQGKIPIVLIHGLLSDSFTWAEMINELQAVPGFQDRFQLWVFEYPTGRAFLSSAAELREQLAEACQTFGSPNDSGLSNMVLVGHSMGGLIAKLQVTSSGDCLWNSVANRPFDQVRMPSNYRPTLQRAFFFEPSPHVGRVIYIGTPHQGSAYAGRYLGRLGAALVTQSGERQQAHEQLISMNPEVFTSEVSRRIPTSIDTLRPRSCLLSAVASLPLQPSTQLHSIIGNSRPTLLHGRSDGVVPVSSARETRAVTERTVNESHSDLNKNPDTVEEVVAILRLHLQQAVPVETLPVWKESAPR